MLEPESPLELASALAEAGSRRRSILLGGNFTKNAMGGPVAPADTTISTRRMNRVLNYEPRDLTISVEAGMPFRELQAQLAAHGQTIPLDPPFAEGTVGGVVAANLSGPRRRHYGTARDMVIGMTFATLEGKLIRTGGMVVKNVAGLDMAKLMIGSFGTLAAIGSVNFKLYPAPAEARTFIRRFGKVSEAIAARDKALGGVLQPASLDLHKTAEGYELLVEALGSPAVLDRFSKEWGEAGDSPWPGIREFTATFLNLHPQGAVVRCSCPLTKVGEVLEKLSAPAIARAGTGVVYGYFENAEDALKADKNVIEFAPQAFREAHREQLWPKPGDDFGMMKKIKDMFDPEALLNRGRLYGRL